MAKAFLMNSGFFVHQDLNLDEPIYRYMKIEFVREMIQNRNIYFRNVTKWEDTWEIPTRYTINVDGERNDYLIEDANCSSEGLFGTCWTGVIDSDALWRIYSPEKSGVCIKTTIRKLFQSIDLASLRNQFIDGLVAPIRYEQLGVDADWRILFDQEAEKYPGYMVPAFVKRRAFEHEQEIRFAIYAPFYQELNANSIIKFSEEKDGLYISFKDLDFIEQIILDPRLENGEVQSYQREFAKLNKEVIKSPLYETPNEIFELLMDSKRGRIPENIWHWTGGEFVKLNE